MNHVHLHYWPAPVPHTRLIPTNLTPPHTYPHEPVLNSISNSAIHTQQSRPAGPMARRLTTNQEIAGSTPASVSSFCIFSYMNFVYYTL
ncbi:uncharacterized protein BDW47DRAFT_111220 [Aspergillus candidus]|uniref:Uncharacterized protein n=1 Tax=Aspergillus candidus TaxID=41067 RepID=A0A2I2F2X2_ASPCN|nr:hypothetical protein BDW47DRAFT_111220 [Aspergillus candidus]PLB34995.1 hypothetical protein BDW47DRAFT_111220 [Aspergillus candidus]